MTDLKRKKILVMIDWYLPGYKGGGPITSISNLVTALADQYDFDIVTSNKDYGDKLPYPDVETDVWHERTANCRVWYCGEDGRSYRHFRKLILENEYDLLYLNSMFSLRFTIFPLWNSRSMKPMVPVLLAPRGMLHSGALRLKSQKKKLFLRLLKWTGITQQIAFQATDLQEIEDIKAIFGAQSKIFQASNFPKMAQPAFESTSKVAGELKLVFISRISEKKGLHLLLEMLSAQEAKIQLDIIGPDNELGYWQKCQAIIERLPSNIQVTKHAPMPPNEAFQYLLKAHCFAMPTYGENFGHAIFEAFSAGRPVLISDKTPWQNLEERKLGFDIRLDAPTKYAAALTRLARMEQDEWDNWGKAAWKFASEYGKSGPHFKENSLLFEEVLKPTEPHVQKNGN